MLQSSKSFLSVFILFLTHWFCTALYRLSPCTPLCHWSQFLLKQSVSITFTFCCSILCLIHLIILIQSLSFLPKHEDCLFLLVLLILPHTALWLFLPPTEPPPSESYTSISSGRAILERKRANKKMCDRLEANKLEVIIKKFQVSPNWYSIQNI